MFKSATDKPTSSVSGSTAAGTTTVGDTLSRQHSNTRSEAAAFNRSGAWAIKMGAALA